MPAPESTAAVEARELSLISKVELRFALADTDSKLQSILQTYLAPLLLKLASDHVSVRNKVIAVCQHLNARIKPPSILLPVAALLKQYKEQQNALVRHFDLLYIRQGLDRMPSQERGDLLPTVLAGLAANLKESAPHTAILFNVVLRILHCIKLPPRGSNEDVDLRAKLGLNGETKDAVFLAEWLGKLILYSPSRSREELPPGISIEDSKFLNLDGKEDVWKPATYGGLSLTSTKMTAVSFLASGAFVDSERYLPALFASSVANSSISIVGDDILRRASISVSLEDHDIIQKLLDCYLGSDDYAGASVPLQIRILALLARSKEASSFAPQIVQIGSRGLIATASPGTASTQANHESDTFMSANADQDPRVARRALPLGLEAIKLHAAIFAFLTWVARVGSKDDVARFVPQLIQTLRVFIERQGWPLCSESHQSPGEIKSRSYSYESIGFLARVCPPVLLQADLKLLRWLFQSLSEDNCGPEVSSSIEKALSSVLDVFATTLDAGIEANLTDLLTNNISSQESRSNSRNTRYVALRFANRCLPFHNAKARWLNILALDAGPSERKEVLEEASKGLDPYWYRNLNPVKDGFGLDLESISDAQYAFPDFENLVEHVFGMQGPEEESSAETRRSHLTNACGPAVAFCRNVLLQQALAARQLEPTIDVNWNRQLDALLLNDPIAREQIILYISETSDGNKSFESAMSQVLAASLDGFVNNEIGESDQPGRYLLDLCSISPGSSVDNLSPRAAELMGLIFGIALSRRNIAAHLFGLLASRQSFSRNELSRHLNVFKGHFEAWEVAVGSNVHVVYGSILAATFTLSRIRHRERTVHDLNKIEVLLISRSLDILKTCRDKELIKAATQCVSQLSLFAVLSPAMTPRPHDASSVVAALNEKAKSGDEGAVNALGHFAMQIEEGGEEQSVLKSILDALDSLHQIRQPDLQFAIGSALSCASTGWQSRSLVGVLDVPGTVPRTAPRSHTLQDTVTKVLQDCKSTKPALRQGSVIWLLCLVQYCGHLEEMQSHLRSCQAAFKSFLADRDSLTQESGARGLTLVYEKGDRELKDDLIRDLVGSFTGTSGSLAGNVSGETELFGLGELPTGDRSTTADGSVTTYKDIMNLAAEVGDPSLVYRFMSLAANNAIWSSRAAFGKFGLSSILSDSTAGGYLGRNPKLYPALYRYRFDPNPNVRDSMNTIWSALVKDASQTTETQFDNIMDGLLKSILGKEWRVRQATCAAIADLLQGKPLEKYEKYLMRIWTLTFKVCDDIKESVRTAAMALARVLTSILVRSLEAGDVSASRASKILPQILPFLLGPAGLDSSAQEVQEFALQTLLEVIKTSNKKVLRPFAPDLVGRLLGLLSSLEPQAVNYVHMNADKYGLTAQQIDDVRLNSIRGSPLMEAIERCLDMLDETSVASLQVSLENALKTSVGLPSKVGISRALVSLSTRHSFLFKGQADHFVRILRSQVLDRNDTISTSYATACGYLARLSSDVELLSLFDFSKKLYFDAPDDRHRVVSAEIIQAVAKHATDRFGALADTILPFVFIAKHDSNERIKNTFQDTWTDNVGGSRAVLLYLPEIISMADAHLESPNWSIKHTAAFAIAGVIDSSGKEIPSANANLIFPALDKALNGKSWAGKETVLTACIRLAKCAPSILADEDKANKMQAIVMRESKRQNTAYRKHALSSLGEFVELRPSSDYYDMVYDIIEPVVTAILDDSSKMDVEMGSMGLSSATIEDETLASALGALIRSINPASRLVDGLVVSLSTACRLMVKSKTRNSKAVQYAIVEAEKPLFQKFSVGETVPELLESPLIDHVAMLFDSEGQPEQLRLKASEVILMITSRLRNDGPLRDSIKTGSMLAMERERSLPVKQSLNKILKAVQ